MNLKQMSLTTLITLTIAATCQSAAPDDSDKWSTAATCNGIAPYRKTTLALSPLTQERALSEGWDTDEPEDLLYQAIACGDMDKFDYALEHGANLTGEIDGVIETSPLMILSRIHLSDCHTETKLAMVRKLITRGVDVNATTTKLHETALMRAACFKRKNIIEILIAANADTTLVNNKNKTAYDIAAASGASDDILELLRPQPKAPGK